MTKDLWADMQKLKEGTLLARVVENGSAVWCAVSGGELELLDEALLPTGRRRDVKCVNFCTPIDPTQIWCIGLNYREHAKEVGMKIPSEPSIFMKPLTCLAAHGEPVKLPGWAGRVDYEGELAVVIGRACRNVSEDKALDYVMGYSCFNDVSARDLQAKDGQWVRSKGFDTFGPFGPALLITKSLPAEAGLTTRLNGTVVQKSGFADMIFSVASIIAHLSRFATLEPGDVIATGTPSGVGAVKPGDSVEVSIDGIGTLRNSFVVDALPL